MNFRKRNYQRGKIKRNHQQQLDSLIGNKTESELKDVYQLFLNYDEVHKRKIENFEAFIVGKFSSDFFQNVRHFNVRNKIDALELELPVLRRRMDTLKAEFGKKSIFGRMFSPDFAAKEAATFHYEKAERELKSLSETLGSKDHKLDWICFENVEKYFLGEFKDHFEQECDKLKKIGIEILPSPREIKFGFDSGDIVVLMKKEINYERLRLNIRYKQSFYFFLSDKVAVEEYFKGKFSTISKRKEERNLRALAAEKSDKQRSLASSNRTAREFENQILIVNCCPYCGGDLGGFSGRNAAHFEHIHPVSKGGLSTIENTVFICSGCNSKKSNMTLNAFILNFSLERDAVFERLTLLGKDF